MGFSRISIAQRRVGAVWYYSETRCIWPCLCGRGPGGVHGPVDSLNFKCSVERFGECIIKTRADASNRVPDIELPGRLGESLAEVLRTAINVEDSAWFEAVVARAMRDASMTS
jgi:hypothetical protein